MAIVGPLGAGKRTIAARFEERVSAQAAERGDTSVPVVLVRSWTSNRALYETCVDRCDATSSESVRWSGLKAEQRRAIAIDVMKAAGVRVLIVAPLYRFDSPGSVHVRHRVQTLDAFVRDLGVALVCLHDSTLPLPGTWPSPWRQARQVTLHPCTLGPEFDLELRSFERRLPLREPSKLEAPDLAGRLYAFSRGDLGALWLRLVEYTVHALYSKSEKIDHGVIDGLEECEREEEDRASWDYR